MRGEAGDGSWTEELGALSSGHGLACVLKRWPWYLGLRQGEGVGGWKGNRGQEGWGLQIWEMFGTRQDLVCAGGRWHLSLQYDRPPAPHVVSPV